MLGLHGVIACLAVGALVMMTADGAAAQSRDRHAGYYYPVPQEIEDYTARAGRLPGVNRARRIGFVVGVTTAQLQRPYPPDVAMFAKGAQAEKLIITALSNDRLDTKYRMRGRLAIMTSVARTLPIVQQTPGADALTFLDVAYMLGFSQITISNGDDFAHQILLLDPRVGGEGTASSE